MALYVSTDDLKQVAKNLLSKKETIANIYKSKVETVLEESKEAVSASGVDFEEFKSTFSKVFSRVDTKLENLANALTNDIIPKYEGLNSYVGKSFNVDFANEMNSLLDRINE